MFGCGHSGDGRATAAARREAAPPAIAVAAAGRASGAWPFVGALVESGAMIRQVGCSTTSARAGSGVASGAAPAASAAAAAIDSGSADGLDGSAATGAVSAATSARRRPARRPRPRRRPARAPRLGLGGDRLGDDRLGRRRPARPAPPAPAAPAASGAGSSAASGAVRPPGLRGSSPRRPPRCAATAASYASSSASMLWPGRKRPSRAAVASVAAAARSSLPRGGSAIGSTAGSAATASTIGGGGRDLGDRGDRRLLGRGRDLERRLVRGLGGVASGATAAAAIASSAASGSAAHGGHRFEGLVGQRGDLGLVDRLDDRLRLGRCERVGLGRGQPRRDDVVRGRRQPVEPVGRVDLVGRRRLCRGDLVLVGARGRPPARPRSRSARRRRPAAPGTAPAGSRGRGAARSVRQRPSAVVPAVAARVLAAGHAEVERRVERVELVGGELALVVAAGRGHGLVERRVVAHDPVLQALRRGS